MKRTGILMLLFFMAFGFNSYAQSPKATLVVDFTNTTTGEAPTIKGLDELNKLKRGDLYQVEITGLNTALYKVTVNKTDSTTQTALEFPSFTSFSTDGLTALISALGGATGVAQSLRDMPDSAKMNYMILESRNFLKGKLPDFQGFMNNKALGEQPKNKQVELKIAAYEALLTSSQSDLIDLKTDIDNIFLNASKLFIAQQLLNKSGAPYTTLAGSTTMESLTNDFIAARTRLDELQIELNKRNGLYMNEMKGFSDILALPANKALYKRDSIARATYAEFVKTIDSAKITVSAAKFTDMVKPLINAQNNTANKFTSMPLQFTKDETHLSLAVVPVDKDANLPSWPNTEYVFPYEKDWFVGVSSGFFVSSLYDSVYSTTAVAVNDTVTKYGVVGDNTSKAEFGVNAMIRYGLKFKCDAPIAWHVGIGPGLAISGTKVKARLMFGTGLAFGDKHKFLIDIGGALGNVDRISRLYTNSSALYNERPTGYMGTCLKVGVYGSIGYMFAF